MRKFYTLLAMLAFTAATVNAQVVLPKNGNLPKEKVSSWEVSLANDNQSVEGTKAMRAIAKASAKRTLGYGSSIDNGLGINGSYGDSIAAGICIPKASLAAYAGGKITELYIPLYQYNSAKLKKLYGWVASGNIAVPVAQVKATGLKKGYIKVTLPDGGVEIDDTQDLYLGASYVQSKTASSFYPIGSDMSVDEVEGGFLLGLGSTDGTAVQWEDYSQVGYGNYAIYAIVEGVDTPDRDAAISGLTLNSENISLNSPLIAQFKVLNNGVEPITSFDIEAYVNGELVGTESFSCDIALDKAINEVTYPEHKLAVETMGASLVLKLVNVNDNGDDDDMSNNTTEAVTFNVFEQMFDRNVLVEEGTGTWCGWCVRGYIGMETMGEKYPESFAGVAVHASDEMEFLMDDERLYTYGDYAGYAGYPSSNIDRLFNGVDPNADDLEMVYQFQRMQMSLGTINATAKWQGDNIVVDGAVEFVKNQEAGGLYTVGTLLVEDEVGPYKQTNYYAGGSYGPMGGFESKGSSVNLIFNDVLRGAYPNYYGELQQDIRNNGIVKGQSYPFSYTYEITAEVGHRKVNSSNTAYVFDKYYPRYQNKDNLRLVVFLADQDNNGEIVNVVKVAINPDTADGVENIESASATAEYYTIDGMRLSAPAKNGLYIEKTGGKAVKKIAK